MLYFFLPYILIGFASIYSFCIAYIFAVHQKRIYSMNSMYRGMETDTISFLAKIDKRGHIYVPSRIQGLLANREDRHKMFQVTIEKRE